MPVILSREQELEWLQNNDKTELLSLLKPYRSDDMLMYEVSKAVNSYKNNGQDLLKNMIG